MNATAALDPLVCWQITLTLLHVGWLGVLIAGLATAGHWGLRKAPAVYRYGVSFGALLALGLCLPITFAVVRLATPRPPAAPTPAIVTRSAEPAAEVAPAPASPWHQDRIATRLLPEGPRPADSVSRPGDTAAVPEPPRGGESPAGFWNAVRTLSPGIAAIYAVGVLAMLVKLIVGVYGGQRLRAICRPITESRLLEIVARQSLRLGLRVAPLLGECERVAVPVVVGVLRPMIAMPAAMVTGLTLEQFAAVLTHELAHLRRHDHLLILVQRLIEAALFFHPAAWYLGRRTEQERENCCDDLVVAAGGDRLGYAQSLLRVAELRLANQTSRGQVAALAADGQSPSRLRRRIARLLGVADEPRVRLTRSGLLTAVLFVVVLAGGLSASLLPSRAETKTPAPIAEEPQPNAGGTGEKVAPTGADDVRWPWRVVDQETGKPLPGVAIAARVRKPQPEDYSGSVSPELLETFNYRSDADGRFLLVLPGRLRQFSNIEVRMAGTLSGYTSHERWEDYEFQPRKTAVKEATLRLMRGAPASGRILNPDGSPAAHLHVQCSTYFEGPPPARKRLGAWASCYTDSNGRFQLVVPTRGASTIFLRPPKALRAARTIGQARGDLGDLRLEAGLIVRGRALDETGKPLPYVSVEVRPVLTSPGDFRAISDAQGRFELPPQLPGEYWIQPLPDLEIDGQTPAERLPEPCRKLILAEDVVHVERPLPATFVPYKMTLRANQPPPAIELKAVPHVKLTARFADREGKPTPAWTWSRVGGWLDGQSWTGRFYGVPGKHDTITAIVPRGLQNAYIQNDRRYWQSPSPATAKTAYWWRWTPTSARMPHDGIALQRIDQDYPAIRVQRVASASLEIRLRTRTGRLPKEPLVRIHQANYDRQLSPASPGVYRSDYGLVPDRDVMIDVIATGFRPISQPLQFTEEGQQGVVELTLVPGTERLDNVPITLLTPECRPIVKTPVVEQPRLGTSIGCRAVDAVTLKPVADAVVKVEVRQLRDETGQSMYRALDTRTMKTSQEGRFTVVVPQKYLTDADPQRSVDVFVTVSHPRYVTAFGFGDPRQIAKEGVTEKIPEFRLLKLQPAREIFGRIVDPQGRPVPDACIYKVYEDYGLPSQTRDAENPITPDAEGRFRTKVPAQAALKLEVRTAKYARNYQAVPADRNDLGVLRLLAGVRITGRVVDSQGQPVRGLSVTMPSQPNSGAQPDFVYYTDKEGRFQSDELAPGKYLLTVGGIYDPDQPVGFPIADAPGVYIPLPLEIRAGQPVAELMLRPVEDVRCVATLINTRPPPVADEKPMQPKSIEELGKLLGESFFYLPNMNVHGRYQGTPWAGSTFSLRGSAGGAAPSDSHSSSQNQCTLRVAKGLTDVTIEFGYMQHFQLDEKSPNLFGSGVHLARIDHDLTGIRLYRYRETTLKVHVEAAGGKADVRLEARYVRQQAMRDAGAIFPDSQPVLKPEGTGGDVRYSVLPGEEIELSAAAAGMKPAVARVQLQDGETRALTLTPTVAR